MHLDVEPWNAGSTPRKRTARREVWWVLGPSAEWRGALGRELVVVAERLRARGVGLVCVLAGRAPAAERAALAALLDGSGARLRRLDGGLTAPFRLLAWLLAARPALVHLHFVGAFSSLVAAARLSGARVVVSDHAFARHRRSWLGLGGAFERLRGLALVALCDRRVADSELAARSVREVERVPPARIEVIEPCVELERFRADEAWAARTALDDEARPLLVCASPLEPAAGVESAIRALAIVGRRAVLALLGDGPQAGDLRALAERLGLADRVQFLGGRAGSSQLVAAADVVLVPSHEEDPRGLDAASAMSAGRPVVVSAAGVLPRVVGDGGLVVPPRDPGALAGAVTRVLDDPQLAERLGRAGRARAERCYGVERAAGDTLALYDRLSPALAS